MSALATALTFVQNRNDVQFAERTTTKFKNCPFLIYSANVEVPGDERSKEEKEKVKQQEKEKYKAKGVNS